MRVSRPDVAVQGSRQVRLQRPARSGPKSAITEENKQTQSPPVLQKKPFVGDLKTPK